MATQSESKEIGYWQGFIKSILGLTSKIAVAWHPGIGERVNQIKGAAPAEGTRDAAAKANRWINDMGKISVAADLHGFDVISTAPRYDYEFGEQYLGPKAAKEILKADGVIALTNSLGQYGFSRQAHADPEFPKLFTSLLGFVTGDGMLANTAKNIADAKLPCWFFTCENDTASGTNPQATIKLHKAILAAGGISWLTCLRKGQYENKNAHQIISVVLPMLYDGKGKKLGDAGALTTSEPLGEKGIQNVITTATMSPIEWALKNSRTKWVAPDAVISEIPIPEPPIEETPPVVVDPVPEVPPPVVVPPVNKIGIAYVLQNQSGREGLKHTSVQIHWADGKVENLDDKIPPGYRNAGTWENKKAGTYTLDIKQVGTEKDGEKIIIGPYRKI